jgi:Holliday junction resolvase RusA-like endonuclease
MRYISVRISGVPYSKLKARGDLEAPKRWTEAVIRQTKELPQISEACLLKTTFLLPPDKFPADFPHGPDLDNLLKRLFDALNRTIFRDTPGGDSCVVSLMAMKTRVASAEESGVHLEILPISTY